MPISASNTAQPRPLQGSHASVNPLTGSTTLHGAAGNTEITTNPFTDTVTLTGPDGKQAKLTTNPFTGVTTEQGGGGGQTRPNLFGGATFERQGQKTRIYPTLTGVRVEGPNGTSKVYKDLFGRIQVQGPELDPAVFAEAKRQLDAQK